MIVALSRFVDDLFVVKSFNSSTSRSAPWFHFATERFRLRSENGGGTDHATDEKMDNYTMK